MKTVSTERAYSFGELTNPDFEYCPYSRAPQAEFDFGIQKYDGVTTPTSMRFTCFEEHCRFVDSLILKTILLSFSFEPDTAGDLIAPVFLMYARANSTGCLTSEHSREVYRELIAVVRQYSSLSEVHEYIVSTRH